MVIRLSAIGDVAMVIPHLYSMCIANKDCEFTFLTQPFFSYLLVNAPENLEVLAFDKKTNTNLWHLIRFAQRIRREKFDIIIDLHNVLRTKIICWGASFATKTKVSSIDKKRSLRKKLIQKDKETLVPSMSDIYREAISKVGINPIGDVKPIIFDGYNCIDDISIYCDKDTKKIGLAPFASKQSKEVDITIIEQIVDYVSKNTSAKIFLFCSKSERCRAERIISKYENTIIPICGQIGLTKELFIISQLSCMISMDSANMHFASMVGTPVISLWAGTSVKAGFLGIGQKNIDVIANDSDCSPCSIFGTNKCRLTSFECKKTIDIDRIIERINFYINN